MCWRLGLPHVSVEALGTLRSGVSIGPLFMVLRRNLVSAWGLLELVMFSLTAFVLYTCICMHLCIMCVYVYVRVYVYVYNIMCVSVPTGSLK